MNPLRKFSFDEVLLVVIVIAVISVLVALFLP
jgi:hypothetical protein